jgi:hypothetical protein
MILIAVLAQSSGRLAAQEVQMPEDQGRLDAWRKMSEEVATVAAARNLAALGFAVHNYADANGGKIPPIAVPNPALPFEKRLSGLVLLLPYIGQRPSYVSDEDWPRHRKLYGVDEAVIRQAKRAYQKIDLAKAWDDPINLGVARTVLPVFLAPKSAAMRDEQGFAVSHFAFVRGFGGVDDGAYTEKGVAITEIVDGTSATMGIGQIATNLGPWLAAGSSTSRYVFAPQDKTNQAGFSGPYRQGWLVGFVDAAPYFLATENILPRELHPLVTRAGGEVVDRAWLYRPLDPNDRERLMLYLKGN